MDKVLIIHNRYRSKGGEDIAVQDEVEFLKNFFEVKAIYFNNKLDSKFSTYSTFLFNYNSKSIKTVKKSLDDFKPNVVYFHNTWFKASPRLISSISRNGYKVIVKIHNYRIYCADSFLINKHIRKNKYDFCPACFIHKKNKFSFFNKVFENSYLKSFFVIIYAKTMKKILMNENIQIVVLNDFHKNKFSDLLENKKELEILKNIKDLDCKTFKNKKKEKYILYAGRISKEKGVEDLILAFLDANLEDLKLKIVGDGPLLNNLKKLYRYKNIEYIGKADNDETLDYIYNSQGVVTATKMYEGQPTLLSEASLLGVPSIFPDFGGMGEYFPDDYELKYSQYNYEDLKNKINLINNDDFRKKTSEYIKSFYFSEYLKNNYYETFKSISKL